MLGFGELEAAMRNGIRTSSAGAARIGAGLGVLLAVTVGQGLAQSDPGVDLSRPFSLEDLYRIAEERNLSYMRSLESIQTSQGTYRSAASALLPSARVDVSASRTISEFTQPRVDINTGEIIQNGVTDVSTDSRLTLSGGLNLVDLPAYFRFRGAGKGVVAAREGAERSRQDLRNLVAQRYYEMIRAQQLTQVNDGAYQLSTEQLRRAQSLYDLGSVARSDVLQAQVNLAAAERDRISAINSVEIQRARLALVLGIPVSSAVEVDDPEALPATLPEAGDLLEAEAMRNRPDLQQAEVNLAAAGLESRAAKWSRYPDLGAGYSYSKRGDQIDDLTKNLGDDISYSVSLGINWTIFDGFNTKGAIQRAEAARRSQQRTVEETRLQVALEVHESRIAIKNASESIRSAEEGVRLAEESVKLQQALYESGGGTLLEWNNSQVELTRARKSLVDGQVDLHLALAGLELALGR